MLGPDLTAVLWLVTLESLVFASYAVVRGVRFGSGLSAAARGPMSSVAAVGFLAYGAWVTTTCTTSSKPQPSGCCTVERSVDDLSPHAQSRRICTFLNLTVPAAYCSAMGPLVSFWSSPWAVSVPFSLTVSCGPFTVIS